MCGHVGVAGKLTFLQEKIFGQLLVVDALRGTDSTGVAIVDEKFNTKIVKQQGDPYFLLGNQNYTKALGFKNYVCMGHNRWATVGKVSDETSHPFEFESLIGAHNGTLTSKWMLDTPHKFAVDSENLFHHIDSKGLADALSKMGGAWALVWWDKVDNSLNFLRNKERPLFWSVSEDGEHLYWASEPWMLEGVLGRNGIKFIPPQMFEEDIHTKIMLNENGSIGDLVKTPAKSTYTPSYQTNWKGGAWFGGNRSAYPFHERDEHGDDNLFEYQGRNVIPLLPPSANNTVITVRNPNDYALSKQIYVRLVEDKQDCFGAPYFKCVDINAPQFDIRLYYQDKLVPFPENCLNVKICIDIGHENKRKVRGQLEERYFKAIPSSVPWPFLRSVGDSLPEDEDFKKNPSGLVMYPGHDHHTFSEEAWKKKYGQCGWCACDVSPKEEHVLTTTGDCYCGSCVEEARPYVNFVGEIRNQGVSAHC